MTFKILTDDTKIIINRSNGRSLGLPLECNLHLDPLCGESKQFIKSKFENIQLYKIDETNDENKLNQSENKIDPIPLIKQIDLIGRSFLLDIEDSENKLRTQIMEAIHDHDKATKSNPEHIRFR